MHSQHEIEEVASTLLRSQSLRLNSCKNLQTLWAGYGHICAVQARSSDELQSTPSLSLILKYVCPPVKSKKQVDEGHIRKVISYQVEQYFYAHLAPQMPKHIAVASCIASVDAHDSSSNITAMVLTDLREQFPVAGEKRGRLSRDQVHAAIEWLAGFHGFWWSRVETLQTERLRLPPLDEVCRNSSNKDNVASEKGSVWLNGGYTYLATRRSEYADLVDDDISEWSQKLCSGLPPNAESLAERVAMVLTPTIDQSSPISAFQTLIHGDVKSENLFTTKKGDAVAFYDFQYVGLGLGVCDLAKLFTCSVPVSMLCEGKFDGTMHSLEEELLHRYIRKLESTSGKKYDWNLLQKHWQTALVDWLRFQASWGFWGNTEWLESRVRSIVEDQGWREWLDENAKS